MTGQRRFFITAGVSCLILALLAWCLFHTVLSDFAFGGACWIPCCFALCVCIAYSMVQRGTGTQMQYMTRLMAAFVIKFIAYLIIMLAWVCLLKGHHLAFSIVFFVSFVWFEGMFTAAAIAGKKTSAKE